MTETDKGIEADEERGKESQTEKGDKVENKIVVVKGEEVEDLETGENDRDTRETRVETEVMKEEVLTMVEETKKSSKRALKREKKWKERQQKMRERRREEKKRRDKKKREHGVGGRRGKAIKLSDEGASKVSVALDCSFEELMTPRELEGLSKQIKYCYASNRGSSKPIQLHLCSYGGGVKECLNRSSPEHGNWDLHLHSQEITDMFTADQLVYLTADSNEVVRKLSADKCYVIGGLLDHNRHKGACLERAKRLGISHGRLGLEEVVKLNSRAVLTVNHVFDILLRYISSGDWSDAILSALPSRKINYVRGIDTETDSKLGDVKQEADAQSDSGIFVKQDGNTQTDNSSEF